jgi:hypothetical protein
VYEIKVAIGIWYVGMIKVAQLKATDNEGVRFASEAGYVVWLTCNLAVRSFKRGRVGLSFRGTMERLMRTYLGWMGARSTPNTSALGNSSAMSIALVEGTFVEYLPILHSRLKTLAVCLPMTATRSEVQNWRKRR